MRKNSALAVGILLLSAMPALAQSSVLDTEMPYEERVMANVHWFPAGDGWYKAFTYPSGATLLIRMIDRKTANIAQFEQRQVFENDKDGRLYHESLEETDCSNGLRRRISGTTKYTDGRVAPDPQWMLGDWREALKLTFDDQIPRRLCDPARRPGRE